MQLRISDQDGVPIYVQVVRQIKYLVSSGRLTPGDQLPPVRKLAEQLLINPNTVDEESLIDMIRRRSASF